jgi:hypothetical protein
MRALQKAHFEHPRSSVLDSRMLASAPVPTEGWTAEAEGLVGSGAGGGVVSWAAEASAPTECVLAIRSCILPRGGRQTFGGNWA